MYKNIFIAGLCVFITLCVVKNIFFAPAGELAELGKRTAEAESALAEASVRLDRISERHAFVVDSLKQESDSLVAVAGQARRRATVASTQYDQRARHLADSLAAAGEEIISEQIFSLQQSHDSVVVALNDEIDALNADRALLWRRIEVSDSLIGIQAMQIRASEAVVAALTNERDAWRVEANPPLPKRLFQSIPTVLATAVIVSTLR